MALIGPVSSLRAQFAATPGLRVALDYVAECFRDGSAPHTRLLAAVAGHNARVELGGGVFALEQIYLTKPRTEGRWETHVAHIDVQAVIAGTEHMETADRALLTVAEDRTPAQDVIFYAPFDEGSVLRLGAGNAAIYYPADAHMGSLAIGGVPSLVRKTVVKVPVGA
ncbi:MAG: YhcH/YjgK/YiaL family protein [Verrucomicrobiota bacterium]